MTTRTTFKTFGLLTVALMTLAGSSQAFAQPFAPQLRAPQPRLRPLPPARPIVKPLPSVPRLGFMGQIRYGQGMVVNSVSRGSFASRIGLERGDIILSINQKSIRNDRSYENAVLDAVRFQNGHIEMRVVDVRTGRTRVRSGFLNTSGGHGPIMPRSAPHLHASYRDAY